MLWDCSYAQTKTAEVTYSVLPPPSLFSLIRDVAQGTPVHPHQPLLLHCFEIAIDLVQFLLMFPLWTLHIAKLKELHLFDP